MQTVCDVPLASIFVHFRQTPCPVSMSDVVRYINHDVLLTRLTTSKHVDLFRQAVREGARRDGARSDEKGQRLCGVSVRYLSPRCSEDGSAYSRSGHPSRQRSFLALSGDYSIMYRTLRTSQSPSTKSHITLPRESLTITKERCEPHLSSPVRYIGYFMTSIRQSSIDGLRPFVDVLLSWADSILDDTAAISEQMCPSYY